MSTSDSAAAAAAEATAAAEAAQARDALNRADFSASIFKRGQKAELFEDGQVGPWQPAGSERLDASPHL